MSFKEAFAFTLEREGGYVNNPRDRGGETKYGIAKNSHPDVDIMSLTVEQAASIYHNEYWVKAQCDLLPSKLATVHFDFAVHSGTVTAIKVLQRTVGVAQDGIIGPDTLAAIGRRREDDLILDYLVSRLAFLERLDDKDPSQAVFQRGWFKRVLMLAIYVK